MVQLVDRWNGKLVGLGSTPGGGLRTGTGRHQIVQWVDC